MTVQEPAPAPDAASADEGGSAPVDGPRGTDGHRRGISPNVLVGLLLGVVGLQLGLSPLHDNSFFTHLATGHLILDSGSIPRVDPYSFTAHGRPWVVQSWGASVIYAGIDDAVGFVGLRLLLAACTAGLSLLAWRLTRPAGGLVGRLAVVVPAIGVGAGFWVERPLVLGMVFLGVVLLAAEDQLDARWLVPLLFLWVNVHGSFPLGLVAIGTLLVGRLLDRQRAEVELRALAWAVVGTLLGVVNPLGWRLLAFPVDLLSKRDAFSGIVEWQPPTWASWGERFFAVQLALAVVLFLLRGRSWRLAVPTVVFGAASLMSSRNIVQASLVLVPVMAAALAGLGALDGRRPLRAGRPAAALVGALAILVLFAGLARPNVDLTDYPVETAAWMRRHDLLDTESRVVARDFVGNYLELEYGPDEVRVYIDDRVDMYPIQVIRDYTALLDDDADADHAAVLRRARATAVLWDLDSGFGRWLASSPDWRVVHTSDDGVWIVAVPAGRRG